MTSAESLVLEARDAFRHRDWVAARSGFVEARRAAPLAADDLFALSDASWWLGLVDESMAEAAEAYHLFVAEGRDRDAANACFGIAYTYSLRGDEALASGWGARAARHIERLSECDVHGFMVYMEFEAALTNCDYEAAMEHARTVGVFGDRFGDPNLRALGVLGEGRVLARQGRVAEGMARLDEAMVAAISPDLDPSWAGHIYCNLVLACHELADIRRAAEWTRAIASWCESMPGAGPFMGICRVHRAQVLRVQGEWQQAETEVTRVAGELAHFHVHIVAEAYYELGEVKRLRGDLAGAESAFREAHQRGRDPQPGLALLRVAQGDLDAAAASLDSLLAAGPPDRLGRVRPLAARVEVALAMDDLETAERACGELEATAAAFGTSGLQATAPHLRGATLLAAGKPAEALPILRRAFHCWHELGAPYEGARVRLLIAEASERLGDSDTASLERGAAASVFKALGVAGETRTPHPAGLTAREMEVLLLATEGLSNSEIADRLVLSIRTVERHLATVYQKLGFSGRNARAAAISFAFREGLHTHP